MVKRRVPAETKASVLAFAKKHVLENEAPPTINQIAEGVGITRDTVRTYLRELRDDGALLYSTRPRQLVVFVDPKESVTEEHQALVEEATRRLGALLPHVPPSRLAEIAEEVAKAVERHNAKEESTP